MSEDEERMPRPRTHRRVTTAPAPGSDPAPALPKRIESPEERSERNDSTSNDERLKRDVPPHW